MSQSVLTTQSLPPTNRWKTALYSKLSMRSQLATLLFFFPSTCSTNSKWMTSKGKEISVMPELALQNGLDDWRIQVWLHCTTCVFSPTPQPTIYDHLTYNTGTQSVFTVNQCLGSFLRPHSALLELMDWCESAMKSQHGSCKPFLLA